MAEEKPAGISCRETADLEIDAGTTTQKDEVSISTYILFCKGTYIFCEGGRGDDRAKYQPPRKDSGPSFRVRIKIEVFI